MDLNINDNVVIQDWLKELTFKQQTVLLSAIRGCDGVLKEDLSKKFVRNFRYVILKDAANNRTSDIKPRPDCYEPPSFMQDVITDHDYKTFMKSLDHYPMHWLLHFTHAVQIIGLYHPDGTTRSYWDNVYFDIVNALHFKPEYRSDHEERLKDGRPSNCWKS